MYDYVIVGASSAGCVLANRLSEDPETTVLLLEAGSLDTQPEIAIPAAFPTLFKSSNDWNYETEPQEQLNHRTMYTPRGKVLGGTSSINATMYIRGHRSDFDTWEKLGNKGWSYEEVLAFFKKSEHWERGASPYHGSTGPLSVADLRSPSTLTQAFIRAALDQGYPPNTDCNGEAFEGVGTTQVTQTNGQRCSTAEAFLRPAFARPNLSVVIDAQATRILFEQSRAVGVEYIHNGKNERASASAEVLVCAGAINSPHLLLLSGIGPVNQLKALDLPVVADLPGVGANLQDHFGVGVNYSCTQPLSLAGAFTTANQMRYRFLKQGPLTSCVGEAVIFLKTRDDLAAPDLEIVFAPSYFINHGFDNPQGHGYIIGAIASVPASWGRITLRPSQSC